MRGFHFSQRQGTLDVKSIRLIDLDRVVRETDVDVLQMNIENIAFSHLREDDVRRMSDPDVMKLFRISQLMLEYLLYSQDSLAGELRDLSSRYAAKKRDLAGKRKEVIELTEATRQLKSELVNKRRGITSLEDMLKKATRDNRDAVDMASAASGSAAGSENGAPSSATSGQNVKQFYVTCPDGLSIEYNFRVTMMIYELKGEIRKFITDRIASTRVDEEVEAIKLVYRGKILADQMSLGEADIRDGDSVIALVSTVRKADAAGSEDVKVESRDAAVADDTAAAAAATASTPELVEILNRQQDMMAALADALKEKSSSMVTNSASMEQGAERSRLDAELLMKLDDRWASMEVAMRSQLDAQLSHYQQLLKEQNDRKSVVNSLRAGDIESDDDGVEQRMRDAVAYTELRGKLQKADSRINTLESTVVSGEERQRILMETIEGLKGELKLVRQQQVGETTSAPTGSKKVPRKKKGSNSTPGEEGEKAKDKGEGAAPPVESTKRGLKTAPPKFPAPPMMTPDIVSIVFALNLNPHLAGFTSRYVEVQVKKVLSVDDLIYALRKGVGEATNLPLARIVLLLKGEPIETAADVAKTKVDLSATTAITLASEGELTAEVKKKETLSPAQVDEIRFNEWREIRSQAPENLELIQSVDSDGMPTKVDVRQSLEAALKEVEGKDGLSNEEYANRTGALADLDKSLAAAPAEAEENAKRRLAAAAEKQNIDAGAMSTSVEEIPTMDNVRDTTHDLSEEGESAQSAESAAAAGASCPQPVQSAQSTQKVNEAKELDESDVLDIPDMEDKVEEDGNVHQKQSSVAKEEEEREKNLSEDDSEQQAGGNDEGGEAVVAPPRQKTSSPPVETTADVHDNLDQSEAADVLRQTDESQITMDSFNDSVTSDIREFSQSEAISRADEYERVANESFHSTGGTTATGMRSSDPLSQGVPSSALSKASTASPFGMMSYADADDSVETGDEIQAVGADLNERGLENEKDGTASLASGSFALSESHDTL